MTLEWSEPEDAFWESYVPDGEGYSIEEADGEFHWEAFSPNYADRLGHGCEKTLKEAQEKCQEFHDTET